MENEHIKRIYDAGRRLTPDAIEFLSSHEKISSLTEKILALDKLIVSKEEIENILIEEEKIPIPVEVKRPPSFNPIAKEYEPRVRILEQEDVSGKSRCTGTVEDFISYFRDRYERTKRILKERLSAHPLIKISEMRKYIGQDVKLIAMVTSKRITKKENLLIEIEDEEGSAKVVVSKDEQIFSLAKTILPDEVVSFEGRVTENFLIAREIVWPDLPVTHEQKLIEEDLAIVYLSDLHLGSRYFLEKEFSKFLRWLNGMEEEKELAGKVKYIVIGGDIVDGIGIYPNQERELIVKDIFKQYEFFDAIMQSIPDYIEVLVCPGNHDAVRRAEPQPFLPQDLFKADVHRIGSPSRVEIEGLRHLIYHGTSLDSVIAGMSGLSYANPEKPMLELLKRRNLSPIYGENLIAPERKDYMLIEEEPDVLHMGHIHKNGSMLYRGTVILNSGTFQSQTEFQLKQGHIPTPGIVFAYEIGKGRIRQMNFASGG